MSIDLKAVRDRIHALGLFHYVETAISAADAMENFQANPPGCYVSTATERAEANRIAGRHRQRVRQTVSILFVLGAERADEAGQDIVEETRLAIRDDLVAWMPPGADSAFDYVSYSIRMIAEGLLWGELLLSADYHIVKP